MNKRKELSVKIISEPIDAKYILQNLANNLLHFHNLIEREGLKVKVEIKKSKKSFEIIIILQLLLEAPQAIEAILNLWEKLKREWLKRERKAKKEYREFKIIELKE